jgi:type IV pilus assembly protein PilV
MNRAETIELQSGFSLVEVLVALIIIAVGMLGIAKLEALAVSTTGGSRMRALAALEASSLADAMRADRDYWSAAPAAAVTIDDTGTAGAVTTTDATLQSALNANPNCDSSASGGSAPCTAVNMAAADLILWAGDMDQVMRGSTSTISCQTVPTTSCVIMINWEENTVASNSAESSSPFQAQHYQLVVEP